MKKYRVNVNGSVYEIEIEEMSAPAPMSAPAAAPKAAPAKAKTLAAKVYGELSTLPIMTVRQALTLLLVCGAAN